MHLEKAFEELNLAFNSSWQALSEQVSDKETLGTKQQKALAIIELVYNYPSNPQVSRILEATPAIFRNTFLESQDQQYLQNLATAVPYYGCSKVWQKLSSMDITIPYSMKDLNDKGHKLYQTTQSHLTRLSDNLPAASPSISGWLSSKVSHMSNRSAWLLSGISHIPALFGQANIEPAKTKKDSPKPDRTEAANVEESTSKLMELLDSPRPVAPSNTPVASPTANKTAKDYHQVKAQVEQSPTRTEELDPSPVTSPAL